MTSTAGPGGRADGTLYAFDDRCTHEAPGRNGERWLSLTVWFLQGGLDVIVKRGRYLGSGRDDPAEASHRDDRHKHVGDLVFSRARRQRPGGAPLQADRR